MIIELLQKGDKYLVRYKTGWFWWYVGSDGDWLWPDCGSYMSLEEAQDVIENKKYNLEQSRKKTKVVKSETV